MKISLGERLFRIFNVTFMVILSMVMLFPYLNQLAIALNDGKDSLTGGILFWPRIFTFSNFKAVISDALFLKSMFLSVYRVVLGTFISLMVIISVAYAVSKRDLPFRRVIIWFLMGPSYIGAGIIPIYMLYRTYGLLNNFLVYILPTAFVFYYMIIIKTFFESLPPSIEESAFLDGANVVQVMIRIILPMSLPVIFTVALWSAVGHWNDWTTTLMFVTKKELYPLQFLLMKVVKESELLQQLAQENAMTGGGNVNISTPTPESIKSAVFIVATLPIVTLYPFVQKYFNKGVMIGAVKE